MPHPSHQTPPRTWRLYDATANTWTEETYTLEDLKGHPDPENTYICRADGLPEDQKTIKLADLLYGKLKRREHLMFSKRWRSDMGIHSGGNQRHGIIAEAAQRQQQDSLEKRQSPLTNIPRHIRSLIYQQNLTYHSKQTKHNSLKFNT